MQDCLEDGTLNIILSLAATITGLGVSIYFGRNSARQMAERTTLRRFLRVRQAHRQNGPDICRIAATDSPLALTRDAWILDQPCRLEELELRFSDSADKEDCLDRLQVLRRYLPIDATGTRLDRYHEAVTAFDQPSLWFDAKTYRLLSVDSTGQALSLQVTQSSYWDCFDFAEGLNHEAAHRYLASGGKKIGGPFRTALGDPFDLSARHCGLGFATLTIRVSDSAASFYLHRRNSEVAVGKNETSLIPAGEFQPSDDSHFALQRDLDLWFAMMREYAEEMLDMDEVREAHGAPVDYETRSPQEMQAAKTGGLIKPYLLGIGLDPVAWKAQIYTVCVFDAPTFDKIFAGMAEQNLEGVLEVPTHRRVASKPLTGWNFNESTVKGYLSEPTMSRSAKLVLELAWRHRAVLLG